MLSSFYDVNFSCCCCCTVLQCKTSGVHTQFKGLLAAPDPGLLPKPVLILNMIMHERQQSMLTDTICLVIICFSCYMVVHTCDRVYV